MSKKTIAFAALGGTISMTASDNGGIDSKLGAEELFKKAPLLQELANFHCHTVARRASCALRFDDLIAVLAWAEKEVEQGACAVIVSQGTDTIEQSAFFFDLFWKYDAPLIVIGAMRGAEDLGFDGLANLLTASYVALSADSSGRGVLVVLNEEIHEARWVVKTHATALQTFASPVRGVAGVVLEGEVQYFAKANNQRQRFSLPDKMVHKVFLFAHSLQDDGVEWLDYAFSQGARALVIDGVGSGHVSEEMALALKDWHEKTGFPVVVCSRALQGSTTRRTYGYKGSEIDLQQKGMLMGGYLSALKMRLLLLAFLHDHNYKMEDLSSVLEVWSGVS